MRRESEQKPFGEGRPLPTSNRVAGPVQLSRQGEPRGGSGDYRGETRSSFDFPGRSDDPGGDGRECRRHLVETNEGVEV